MHPRSKPKPPWSERTGLPQVKMSPCGIAQPCLAAHHVNQACMKPRRLHHLLEDVLSAHGKRLPGLFGACRKTTRAVDIHDLRVGLRRVRLLLRVAQPLVDAEAAAGFADWSRKVTLASAPVRDLDVTLEWVADRAGADRVRDRLRAKRSAAAVGFRKAVVGLFPPRRMGRITLLDSAKVRARLAKRFTKRIDALREKVAQHAGDYFHRSVAQRHEVRRLIRQWRYLRELDRRLAARASDPKLKTLLRLQEAMGEIQNLELVRLAFRSRGAGASRELRAALAHDIKRWRKRLRKRLESMKS